MTGFIRPDLRAHFWRWRELLAGVALAALGLWAALGPGGLLGAVGWAVAAAGAGLAITGVQRGRLRAPHPPGPGSVDVDEGQVIYFGPLTGGAVALRDVEELALIRHGQTAHWRLSGQGETLHIPVDAEGREALFNAFTALPGLSTRRLLAALEDTDGPDRIIWTRARPGPRPRLQ